MIRMSMLMLLVGATCSLSDTATAGGRCRTVCNTGCATVCGYNPYGSSYGRMLSYTEALSRAEAANVAEAALSEANVAIDGLEGDVEALKAQLAVMTAERDAALVKFVEVSKELAVSQDANKKLQGTLKAEQEKAAKTKAGLEAQVADVTKQKVAADEALKTSEAAKKVVEAAKKAADEATAAEKKKNGELTASLDASKKEVADLKEAAKKQADAMKKLQDELAAAKQAAMKDDKAPAVETEGSDKPADAEKPAVEAPAAEAPAVEAPAVEAPAAEQN